MVLHGRGVPSVAELSFEFYAGRLPMAIVIADWSSAIPGQLNSDCTGVRIDTRTRCATALERTES